HRPLAFQPANHQTKPGDRAGRHRSAGAAGGARFYVPRRGGAVPRRLDRRRRVELDAIAGVPPALMLHRSAALLEICKAQTQGGLPGACPPHPPKFVTLAVTGRNARANRRPFNTSARPRSQRPGVTIRLSSGQAGRGDADARRPRMLALVAFIRLPRPAAVLTILLFP